MDLNGLLFGSIYAERFAKHPANKFCNNVCHFYNCIVRFHLNEAV